MMGEGASDSNSPCSVRRIHQNSEQYERELTMRTRYSAERRRREPKVLRNKEDLIYRERGRINRSMKENSNRGSFNQRESVNAERKERPRPQQWLCLKLMP